MFCNTLIFYGEGLLAASPTPNWRTTPSHLSAAAYSMYSQLPYMAGSHLSIRNPRTPALYKLLIFQVQNPISIFHRLACLAKSEALLGILKQSYSYGEGMLVQWPTPPKLEDHPLSAVHGCLFNIFTATLHSWRLSPPFAT
jgi:hypothetical protein